MIDTIYDYFGRTDVSTVTTWTITGAVAPTAAIATIVSRLDGMDMVVEIEYEYSMVLYDLNIDMYYGTFCVLIVPLSAATTIGCKTSFNAVIVTVNGHYCVLILLACAAAVATVAIIQGTQTAVVTRLDIMVRIWL